MLYMYKVYSKTIYTIWFATFQNTKYSMKMVSFANLFSLPIKFRSYSMTIHFLNESLILYDQVT